MSRIGTLLAGAFVSCALTASASAATLTFNLGGSTASYAPAAPYSQTVGGVTLTARGYSYAMTPNAFQALAHGANASTVLSTLSNLTVRRTTSAGGSGLGVCPSGEASNQCNQVDADGVNELLRVSVGSNPLVLTEAIFSRVDNNDTLKIFGVTSTGVIEHLGYGGRFDAGAGAGTNFAGISGLQLSGGSGEDQRYRVTLDTARYQEFWFANNNDSADGYRLDGLTFAAVPEPSTWAMLLLGFFGMGAALRTRRTAALQLA